MTDREISSLNLLKINLTMQMTDLQASKPSPRRDAGLEQFRREIANIDAKLAKK